MEKRDLVAERKGLYAPPKGKFVLVNVPEIPFLRVDGEGRPGSSPGFQEAIGALYSVAYTLKFTSKKERGLDWKVAPLEGLFPTGEGGALRISAEQGWRWTLLLPQPEFVTREEVAHAIEVAAQKKPNPALVRLRLEVLREGLCIQTLYVGAYADEGPTIAALHAHLKEEGYVPNGRHHEIYLGDPTRTAPERLRTVLRQPVRKA
jgi:hypothetical protein